MAKKNKRLNRFFDKFSTRVTKITGSLWAFIVAVVLILVWALTGPLFGFSDTWQLVINTGTTIVTFLMVFIIQQTQNKDTTAIHLKLNELIASNKMASNRLVDAEDLTDEELQVLKKFYVRLGNLAEEEGDIHATHTIEEAEDLQEEKSRTRSKTKQKAGSTAKKR
ncbi:MAG: putative small integral rane protein [Chitinophagaceae bacterium]|jgi:low affinity Fe/Cu permease|nr:putative small integral rane protein [Chitinophagaceae bacterium]